MPVKTLGKEFKNSSGKATQTVARKTVYRSSESNRFAETASSDKNSEKSESDELTLRAWKRTYENRRKHED